MKTLTALLFTAAAFALAGCSSTPTTVDSGTIRARTFSFVNPGNRPPPSGTDTRQAAHAMIQEAITKTLASRGVQQVPSGGDVTVAYLVIVGNNVVTTSINDYFGYGRDAAGLLDKAHSSSKRTKIPDAFEAGTLVVDIISSSDYKLLSRSYATRRILRDLPATERQARVQEVVNEVLREVKFKP
jgi:hypothetical protein